MGPSPFRRLRLAACCGAPKVDDEVETAKPSGRHSLHEGKPLAPPEAAVRGGDAHEGGRWQGLQVVTLEHRDGRANTPEASVDDAAEEFASPTSSFHSCISAFSNASGDPRATAAAARQAAPAPNTASRTPPSPGEDPLLGPPPARRDRLPAPAGGVPKLNVWALLKDSVGKDVHKLTLPVELNEPLTDLQRRSESLCNVGLLDQAVAAPRGSLERLLLVTAFAVSIYSNIRRPRKPFKDLMNATHELVFPELGFRSIAEKVRHQPMTHAMHVEGRGWTLDACDEFHIELWLGYVILRPLADLWLTLADGEQYRWNQAPCYIHNIVLGLDHVFLDHRGSFRVSCINNDDAMVMKISEPFLAAFGAKSTHQVTGHLERGGTKVPGYRVTGTWDTALYAHLPGEKAPRLLWRMPPPNPIPDRWGFAHFTLQMNALDEKLAEKLPPTDARFRQDQRLFEEGFCAASNQEKDRLESRQRRLRSEAEAAGRPWQPRWFRQVPGAGPPGGPNAGGAGPPWAYAGGYWEARVEGDWAHCRDIYGPG